MKRFLAQLTLLVLLTVIAYFPSLSHDFIWDDHAWIVQNPYLKNLEGLAQMWSNPYALEGYYPLTPTTFWLEYHLWQLRPFGYHFVNLLLHLLNSIFVWQVLAFLSVPGSWLASLIFALHPVHVETVAWVVERKNLLAFLFYLLSLLFYFRFSGLNSSKTGSAWKFYPLSLLLFVCSILSKPTMGTLPIALLLLLWWRKGRVTKSELLSLVPMIVLGAWMGAVTIGTENRFVGKIPDFHFSGGDRIFIASRAFWFYLGKLLYPAQLIFIYPKWSLHWMDWKNGSSAAGLALLFFVLWCYRNKFSRAPLVAATFFLITLFPTLGFFDVNFMRYSFAADHWQYGASIGIIAYLAGMIQRYRVSLLVPLILAWMSWNRTPLFKNNETIWRDTIQKNPKAAVAHYNLGYELQSKGEGAESKFHYLNAIQLRPDFVEAHNNLGILLNETGKFRQAVPHFREAIQQDPTYMPAYANLGISFMRLGKSEEAIVQFTKALSLERDEANLYNLHLANTMKQRMSSQEAIK